MAYRRIQTDQSHLRLMGGKLIGRIRRHKCMRWHMKANELLVRSQSFKYVVNSILSWLPSRRCIRATPARTKKSMLHQRGSFAAQVHILNSILRLPSVQNRALQTRAQPTPSWRCTRAVCGVSSKQNPLSPQTPYDPVKTRFCPIQVQTLCISVFPIFSLLTAPRCGLWCVCVDRLT
jgi:hypothetical protein